MMEYSTQVKVATITLWNFFAILVNVLAFAIMYMKAQKNNSLKRFFWVQLAMVIWLVGKVLKTVSPTVELRWFFIVFYYFGISLLEATFLDFAYTYYKGNCMKSSWRAILYSIALVQFLLVVSNPCHYLFYSHFGFWGDDFGPLFYVYAGINYICFILSTILCSIKFKKQLESKRPIERYLISIAILAPLVFNVIYITRLLETFFEYLNIQIFDVTPIIYTWSILLFVYATFKYEFFDLSPIMKHEVAKRLEMPLLVLNDRYQILYSNVAFEATFIEAHQVISTIELNQTEKQMIIYDDKFYKCSINFHKSWEGGKYIIGFSDVTAYEMAKKALDKENRDLTRANHKLQKQIDMLKASSVVGARSYIARELHDILGHALVVTIKLLEVSKLFYQTDRERAMDSLNKASNAVRSGFDEMKSVTNKDSTQLYNTQALEKELKSMLKIVDVSGIDVRFYQRGLSKVIDEQVYDTLKRIITELVTNTLKHAKASKLLLDITVLEKKIVLQTMDNGQGIKNMVKGNGLNGIDGRLSLIGGKAKYSSEENEGFSSHIVINL